MKNIDAIVVVFSSNSQKTCKLSAKPETLSKTISLSPIEFSPKTLFTLVS